jgi:hypothetical protein
VIFGNKSTFSVEAEFTSQVNTWIYGRFRVWVGGNPVGTYSEEVLNLNGTTGMLREPVQGAPIAAARLTAAEFLERVFEPWYGGGEYDPAKSKEWGRFKWLSYSEGFETVFSVIAQVGNEVRIVWRTSDTAPVVEHRIPSSEYAAVCSTFLSWLDQGYAERRCGRSV